MGCRVSMYHIEETCLTDQHVSSTKTQSGKKFQPPCAGHLTKGRERPVSSEHLASRRNKRKELSRERKFARARTCIERVEVQCRVIMQWLQNRTHRKDSVSSFDSAIRKCRSHRRHSIIGSFRGTMIQIWQSFTQNGSSTIRTSFQQPQ